MKKTALLLAACLGISLSAATYYVSPEGSDKNPGTSPAKPAKSISRILKNVKGGDTVMLKGGIYRELLGADWSNSTNHAPIVIKAFPDETPIITWGWDINNWKKLPDGLFVADFPYAVCDLWQRVTIDRYLKLNSKELLLKQPGGFWQDPANGRIYVNPLNGSWHDDPDNGGFTAVPFTDGIRPRPYNAEDKLQRRPGVNFVGKNIHLDGLSFEYHSGKGYYLRGRQVGRFYGSGSVRNCSAVATTCGLSTGWYVDGVVFENCTAIRNSGSGLHLGNDMKNVKLINNFLLNNGTSLPFYGNYTAGGGNVYNLARYGGHDSELVDVIGNKVISDDKSRGGYVMRFKGGICKHTNHLNNLYLGSGVVLYSVPGSTATIRNNTVLPGVFNFTIPNTGLKYTPDMKDNLELRNGSKLPRERFVNPEKYDYRLLPDSKHLGKGYAPMAAPVWFVKPGSLNGSGRTPESPLGTLEQLQGKIQSGDTVYFMPGVYTGTLKIKGLKNITLADMSFNKAVWRKCGISFENCSGVKVENLDVEASSFTLKNTQAEFSENRFADVKFTADQGKTVFANSRLEKCQVTSSGRVVFRENIISQVKVSAKEGVSEHNGFVSGKELEAWPFRKVETYKSFAAGVNGRVPLKNMVRGSRGKWIGSRVVPDVKPSLEVEYAKVTPLSCGTKAVVSWKTPKDYVQASIDVWQGKKKVFSDRVYFGIYLSCSNEICIPNLKPGQSYKLKLMLARHNEAKSWQKEITFTTAPKGKSVLPKVIEVGKGKQYETVGAAVRNAANGDTVLIEPGFYPEMINVFADHLTIKAAKPGTVKISSEYMFDYAIQASNVKGLTIEGIDFVGARYSSSSKIISINRSTDTKIRSCRFYAGEKRRMGNLHIYGRYVKGFEVSNCVFDKGFHSVWLLESGDVKIDHNTFWGTGINAIHVGGGEGEKVVITNNICEDVVSNHISPAISVGHSKAKVTCDWNLYWNTKKGSPHQKIFGMGGKLGIHAVGQIMRKDAYATVEECRKVYGVEKNGFFADPKMKDPVNGDFSLKADSPARKRGSDGRDLGADMNIWKGK